MAKQDKMKREISPIPDKPYMRLSTFGGSVNTPTAERLTDTGLKYTRLHTTAI